MSFHVNTKDVKAGLFLIGLFIAVFLISTFIRDLKTAVESNLKERGGYRGLIIDAGKEVKGIAKAINED